MATRGDVRSRSEVTERVERNASDLQEKHDDAESVVEDIEITRQTLEELDFGGTAEGSDEVEGSIEAAENVTVEVFEDKDEEVERLQQDNQEHAGELHERTDSVESDSDRISDAAGGITTPETRDELEKAKEAAGRDIEFLSDQVRRADEAREESERAQRDHQARAHAGRGG